jgi:hypothetical protein
MEGLQSHKVLIIWLNSMCSADKPSGIPEEYLNGDGININYNAST